MGGLPLMAALIALVGGAQAQTAVAAWPSAVVAGDWALAAQNAGVEVLTKAATPPTGPGGYHRIWVRFEFATAQQPAGSGAYLSMQVLTEFDCAQHRSRNLEATAFAAHNLASPLGAPQKETGDWITVENGAIVGVLEKQACGG